MKTETEPEIRMREELRGLRQRVAELESADAERKEAEEKLIRQNLFLNTVLESIPHPFYVVDAGNYRIVMANPATGQDPVLGKQTCHVFTHHNDRPCGAGEHPCPLEEVKRTKKPVVMEHLHYDENGNQRNIEVHAFPIFDASGEVVQMIENCLDITERIRAEGALRESEERFRQFAEHIQEAFWTFDLSDEKVSYVNPACEKIWGRSLQEDLKTPEAFLETVCPEFRDEVSATLEKQLRAEHTELEYQITRPDGSIRWVRDRGFPLQNEAGDVYEFARVAEDITERKRAEEALRLTQFSVDRSTDTVYWMGADARFIYVNDAACRTLGYTREELLTMSVHDINPDFSAEVWPAHWAELKARGSFLIETAHRTKDGRSLPVEIAVNYLTFGGKEYNCALARDITERKRGEREKDVLLEQISCLLRVGDVLRCDGLMVDVFSDVVGVLPAAFACPEKTRVQITFDGEAYGTQPTAPSTRRFTSEILVGQHRRGSIQVFCQDSLPVSEPDLFYEKEQEMTDSTARHLGEFVELRETQAQVLQSSKLAAIGELAASVAHEINNPVNGIINCADILLSSLSEGSKDSKFAGLIRTESSRIAKIVKDLLSFSRYDRTAQSPARMVDIVSSVLTLCENAVHISGVELRVEVPEELPRIQCRSEQLQQVIINLVMNALHAVNERFPENESGKSIVIRAKAAESELGKIVRVTVADNGIGIPLSQRKRIFNPFYTTKGPDKGTGLGLTVSKEIISKHGGVITVESEEGQYTRFHLDLPLKGILNGAEEHR